MPVADDIRAKIEAGQAATATALRTLADQTEALRLSEAAEVLTCLAPHLDRLRRERSPREDPTRVRLPL